MTRRFQRPLLFLVLCITRISAHAADPAVPDLPQVDINSVIPPAASKAISKTVGILFNHRAYQGATSLGTPGFELGVEATLVHLPSDFGSSLSEAGMGSGDLGIGSLPSLKVHLHKSMGPGADIGFSGFWLRGNLIYGGHLKFLMVQPEEGLSWAFRISYNEYTINLSSLGIGGLPINVQGNPVGQGTVELSGYTLTPTLVASRKLDFAEPYLGGGFEYNSGQVEVPITLTLTNETTVFRTAASTAFEAIVFGGIIFRPPNTGIRLGLEMTYGHQGMHTLGLMAGFSF